MGGMNSCPQFLNLRRIYVARRRATLAPKPQPTSRITASSRAPNAGLRWTGALTR